MVKHRSPKPSIGVRFPACLPGTKFKGNVTQHARADYMHIQDPAGHIPSEEPVFLLRGQDMFAFIAVRFWAHTLQSHPDHDPAMAQMALAHADRMESWFRGLPIAKQHIPDLSASCVLASQEAQTAKVLADREEEEHRDIIADVTSAYRYHSKE